MQEKRLKPSMREKKRYLLLETGASRKEIEQAILDYVGVLGYARAAPVFVKSGANSSIIAVNRGEADKVKASFALSENMIKVRNASGTLKGLE